MRNGRQLIGLQRFDKPIFQIEHFLPKSLFVHSVLADRRAEALVPLAALFQEVDVVTVLRGKGSAFLLFMNPNMEIDQRRFVALGGIGLLEIPDLAFVVFLPALSRCEPSQDEFDPSISLSLMPRFGHDSFPTGSP